MPEDPLAFFNEAIALMDDLAAVSQQAAHVVGNPGSRSDLQRLDERWRTRTDAFERRWLRPGR